MVAETTSESKGLTSRYYYECHVTLDPPKDDGYVYVLEILARLHFFKIADLLLVNKTKHTADAFCTARDRSLDKMTVRMLLFIRDLRLSGFVVRRYKIEDIVVDSRINDIHGLLT